MKIIERIVESAGEPNKNDLWLKPGENGSATLNHYISGEWVPVGGGSCGCDMSKIITTDDLFLKADFIVNVDEAESRTITSFGNEYNYVYKIEDTTAFNKKLALLQSGIISEMHIHFMQDEHIVLTASPSLDPQENNRYSSSCARVEFDTVSAGGGYASALYVDADAYVAQGLTDIEPHWEEISQSGQLPPGVTTKEQFMEYYRNIIYTEWGLEPGFKGLVVMWDDAFLTGTPVG